MFCCKCNNELELCTCLDLGERIERMFASPHLHFTNDQKERLRKRAKQNVEQQSTAE